MTSVVDEAERLIADAKYIASGEPDTPSNRMINRLVGALYKAKAKAEAERLKESDRSDELKDALHDLVMLKAQQDIGCVPTPTRDQWDKAWREAEELVRVEP